MKSSLIFQVGMKILTPVLLLGSWILFWRGHHLPGGGFIGGLVAGATLTMHAYCFGVQRTLKSVRAEPLSFVFGGLFCALISGLSSLLRNVYRGDSELSPFSGLWWEVPILETLGTPMLFDFGVYLLVIGFVLIFTVGTLEQEES
jgi:multicomponent Na+:H+ antiporter subunit B